MAKMDKDEFVRRFTEELVRLNEGERFSDASGSVVDYGNDVGPGYYHNHYSEDEDPSAAPEYWANEDYSYWDFPE